MKLEVGMYVRTKNGNIARVEQIDDTMIEFDNWLWQDYELQIDFVNIDEEEKIKTIVKANHKIICLVEKGDYVNGCLVVKVNKDNTLDIDSVNGCGIRKKLRNEDIKTIVTKEQFESMSYKVGE